MNNVPILIDKRKSIEQVALLKEHLQRAANVTEESPDYVIERAKNELYIAKGMFITLKKLRIIIFWEIYAETIDRIEEKHRLITWSKKKSAIEQHRN